jgi:23S rRNA pseudouridine1911/1915/1917 synthase
MPDNPERLRFVADRGDARRRLDQVVVRRASMQAPVSRTAAQRWIDAGAVEVDGRTATRSSSSVPAGATVVVTMPASRPPRKTGPAAEQGPLVVLYEDEHLLALDKPPGTVVHPTYRQTTGTSLNAILWHLRDRVGVKPGILTRLDKDTSGLVLVALSAGVHATLQRDATAGQLVKHYLALVAGIPRPRSGRISLPLRRDPLDRRRIVTHPDGAPSETRYEVLSSAGRGRTARALVRCHLVTGRTHQIRVHLSARGWPIVGDRLYGTPDAYIGRQALHAWRLALPHPVTREPLEIEAPVPDDMKRLLPT